MPATQRPFDAGTRRGEKSLREIGEEFRHARIQLGWSQRVVAAAARIDRADYSRIEAGKLTAVSHLRLCQIGAVLGLNLSTRAFPGGSPIRDAGSARRIQKILDEIGPPLWYRLEVPLPTNGDRPELRAWDVMLYGAGERTAIEFEARLYDMQAQHRRHRLKRRDDPTDHFLLAVADTKANRRVLAEFSDLLDDLPRLRTNTVLKLLRAGRHPPTGFILLGAPQP